MRKTFLPVSIFLALLLLFTLSCDSDNSEPQEIDNSLTSSTEAETGATGDEEIPVMINPNRDYYDVVVVDIDRWELCMNLERARYHCNSYTGHLWYQMGAFIFEGQLTAVYNFQLDQLTVTALDSGWDRGHIMYGLEFVEGTNDLYGSFCYYEFPRRTNGIDCWLVQGQLGPHIYGEGVASEPPVGPVAMEHPKKARFLANLED